jgi:hypothetical protein
LPAADQTEHGSLLFRSCQRAKDPQVNANVNSIFLKKTYRNHTFSLKKIEFTFEFTGGSLTF